MTTENNKTETAGRDGRLHDIRKAYPHGTFFLLIRPDNLRHSAKKALPHRRKHRSAPQKKLFRHTEKPVSHGGKASLATLEKGFYYVGQYILLCISRICKTPKSRVFAAEKHVCAQKRRYFRVAMYIYTCAHVYLCMLPCTFIHAFMYIYSYINTYLRVFVLRTARHAAVFLPPRDNMKGDAPQTPHRDATKEERRHGYAHFCIFNGYFCIFIRF